MRTRAILAGRHVRNFLEDMWHTLRGILLQIGRDLRDVLVAIPALGLLVLKWLGRRPKWIAAWYGRITERERCRRELRVYRVLVWVGENRRSLMDYLSTEDYRYSALTKDEAETLSNEIVADAKQLGLAASCKIEVDRGSVR